MKNEYEKELEDIKKYLEKKAHNDTINKNNPIYKYENLSREDRRVKFDDGYEKTLVDLNKDIINEQASLDNNKRYQSKKYEPYKKDNILLTISIIAFCMFTTFFVISTHSTLLVKKPFNYVSIVISFVSFILIIISIVLKIRHRDLSKSNHKFNKKLTIMTLIISIVLIGIIILLNMVKFWKFLDLFIAHKKMIAAIIGIVILTLFTVFIIRLLMHKRFKDNTRRVLLSLFLICVSEVFIAFNFTLYGPLKGFKEWLITTAMPTMNHQKYCKWFYSDKEIEDVMSKNYVIESGESTDKKLITKKKTTKYKDEYERQILEHEEGEKYKIVKLEVDGMPAYLAAIYDPTSIKVEVTRSLGSRGEYVTKMAERNNALLAINGGGFMDPGGSSWGGTPTGITISNGKIITNNEYGSATSNGGVIGFTEDGTLMLLKVNTAAEALRQAVTNAVSWGPFLIVNGVSSKISGNGGWGMGARTAIGQRSDGVVLFLVVDSNASRTKGATMSDLTEIMERYGAVNASNLDGGTSSVMALPKQIAKSEFNATCHDYFTNAYCAINDPIDSTGTHQTRYIATSFVVLDK